MKLFPSGKVYMKTTEFTGVYSNWLGTSMAGKVWVGSRFLTALVRQVAVVRTTLDTFVFKKPNTTTVTKRAGR